MPAPRRNVRSRMPTDDDAPDELTRAEGMVVEIGRHALRSAVERHAPAGADNLALVAVAVAGMFADILSGMRRAPDLAEVVNRQLRASGLGADADQAELRRCDRRARPRRARRCARR